MSIGFVQVESGPHDVFTFVMLEALAGSVFLPLLVMNSVDVIERFQPFPEPLASITVIGRL